MKRLSDLVFSVVLISIIYQFVRRITDLARFVHIRDIAGSLRKRVRNKKEPTVAYRSVNPATGEVLKTFPEHTDEQMWNALATADKAFRGWAARPFSERSKIIGRSAQILLEQKENSLASPHWKWENNRREPRRSGTERFHHAVLRG